MWKLAIGEIVSVYTETAARKSLTHRSSAGYRPVARRRGSKNPQGEGLSHVLRTQKPVRADFIRSDGLRRVPQGIGNLPATGTCMCRGRCRSSTVSIEDLQIALGAKISYILKGKKKDRIAQFWVVSLQLQHSVRKSCEPYTSGLDHLVGS
jgi:hypothetical protein